MYKTRFFVVLLTVLILSGCQDLIKPEHIDDPKMLAWIFRDCISYSYGNDIQEQFIQKVKDKTISVPGFESIGVLEDAVLAKFSYEIPPIDRLSKYSPEKYISEFGNIRGYSGREGAIINSNLDKANKLYAALCKELFKEYERIATQEITVLNCILNSDAMGDKYTGYIIEYEVGEGYYVLLSLMEYDDSDRYAADIVYKGSSLQKLHEHYR